MENSEKSKNKVFHEKLMIVFTFVAIGSFILGGIANYINIQKSLK